MTEFEKEELKLEDVLKKYEDVIEDLELRIEFLPGKYRDNPYLLANFLSSYTTKLELMKKCKEKPYFARIDFKIDGEEKTHECYLGKVGVINEDNETITVDWRAPIASVYYDSNIGRASYEAPEGTINGELLLKRQYEIEKSKLLEFRDVDTVSNDEILKPYLNANADNRLKSIVASIQSEQNDIIREKLYKNLIVQGVAGSGKTTVALHRVAYLVYNNMNRIKPEQYLVIGPNKFFVNYISGVLPDLDVNNVEQLTYEELTKKVLDEEFEMLPEQDNLLKSINNPSKMFFERLKTSNVYKNAINNYLNDYEKKNIAINDLKINGYLLIPKEIIKKVYDETEDTVLDMSILSKKVDRASLMLRKYIEDNKETISSTIRKEYSKRIEGMSKSAIEKERKVLQKIEKELDNKCNQTLKKYFAKSSPKILPLYSDFLNSIDKYINIDEYDISKEAIEASKRVKNKNIEFEDLAALLYMKYKISGPEECEKYKHVVVDEAQDYGEFNFSSLKELMPNGTFSIFGDLSQSIYQYRSINNWEKVIDEVFDNKCDMKYLLKSYRTTTEVMNAANNIINSLNLKPAEPVIRHGKDVEIKQVNEDDKIETIKNIILNSKENGHSSIAVISKTEDESNKIHSGLKEIGLEIENITTGSEVYNGGICTLPSHLAKGLEFDSVIISDADESIYNSEKAIDMKLLYVAMTRPLHELNILYTNEISIPLQNEKKRSR